MVSWQIGQESQNLCDFSHLENHPGTTGPGLLPWFPARWHLPRSLGGSFAGSLARLDCWEGRCPEARIMVRNMSDEFWHHWWFLAKWYEYLCFFCVFDVFFRFGMGWPTSLNQRSWPTPMTHFQKVDSVREIRPFLSCFFVWNDCLATGLGLKVTYNFFSMFQLQDVLSGTVQCVSPFCFDLQKTTALVSPGKPGFSGL